LNLQSGYGIKHLTLTLPNQVDAYAGAKELIRSFRRLRQRRWFSKRTQGGAWVIEITGRPGRWHVHLHVVLESRYLAHHVLAQLWDSVSPGRIVFIQAIPVAAVINYLTKYVSKSEVDEVHQIRLSSDLRNVRLFQTFGSWHTIALASKPEPFCCPSCAHAGFYLNNSGFIPQKYGAMHCRGTLERRLQDTSLQKYPLPPESIIKGKYHVTPSL
jgi:hypothetical protein